jgi:very-short-patch-repair endonuclease
MELTAWLNTRDGIAHVHDALRAGFTRYAIKRTVERGGARRIRRFWLVTPEADSDLVAAARVGGRVACLSVAKRLNLWHFDDGRLHVAVPPNSGHVASDDQIIHWSRGPIPVSPYGLVEPLENALAHVADCQPFESGLVVWESAIRKHLVASSLLERLPLRTESARRVRLAASALSDSGIETIPAARLRLLGIAVRQQVMIDGHAVDGLIGERLVYQIDGYEFHSDAATRRRDIAEDARLVLTGYTVLRFDYKQVLFDWEYVERTILAAIAQGLHLAA